MSSANALLISFLLFCAVMRVRAGARARGKGLINVDEGGEGGITGLDGAEETDIFIAEAGEEGVDSDKFDTFGAGEADDGDGDDDAGPVIAIVNVLLMAARALRG
jgi:hypothetical protein